MGAESEVKIVRSKTALRPFAMVYGPCARDGRVSDGAFRTLVLADLLCGADGEGHHGMALISQLRGTEIRTIRRHWSELKEAGLIDIEYRNGQTNLITINDPSEVYGRETISGFYGEVKRLSAEMRAQDTPDKNDLPPTPDKNSTPSPDKNDPPPRSNLSPRADDGRADEIGVYPLTGASSPSAPPLTSAAPPDDGGTTGEPPMARPKGEPPPTTAHHVQGIVTDAAERGEEDAGRAIGGKSTRRPRVRTLLDPTRPLAEWRAQDAVGYFRDRFRVKWPADAAPDWTVKALHLVGDRIKWLKDEKQPIDRLKQVIDHIIDQWDNGLGRRIGWDGARPGFALIESARWFERLLCEVTHGPSPGGGVRKDQYDAEGAKALPKQGWHK